MQNLDDRLVYSATDLSRFLACPHLSLLERRSALGGPRPPVYDDPALEALWERGLQHERQFLEALRSQGRQVVELGEDRSRPYAERCRVHAQETLAALRAGADAVYQAALFDGTWLGKADFLLRVERPSALGAWSYEVVDTKLAREAKGGALLQVLLYADLLAQVQGGPSEHVHIALGGPRRRIETFRVADYAAYFRSIRERFMEHVQLAPLALPVAAEPVEHCDVCAWSGVCADERRSVDHLSLVAGIRSEQRHALRAAGIDTLEKLASVDPSESVEGVTRTGLARIHAQARIQLEGRRARLPRHELLPLQEGAGLATLPEPSPGDLFFDLEGDPYYGGFTARDPAQTEGIEYLFGVVDAAGEYTHEWALDRDAEQRAFERFIDRVMARLEQYPDLHIYHYNHYETTALKRLMGRYATREDEVDRLLRGGVFVDLYRVVRQGVRASVESYSIKKLEPFYGYTRSVDLRQASRALARFEAWLELGGTRDDALFDSIAGYNRDDCVSTLRLRDWLERLRIELSAQTGAEVPRPLPVSGDVSEEVAARDAEVDAVAARLVHDVPADGEARTPEQQGRWLAAQLLDFHRREKKSMWWEYHRCLELSAEELIEDRATLGGLEYVGVVDTVAQSFVHRYRYPRQDHGLRADSKVVDHATEAFVGSIVAVDDAACTIDLKRKRTSAVAHPSALVLKDDVNDMVLRQSVLRIGSAIADGGFDDCASGSAADLLLRRAPRAGQALDASLLEPGESPLEAAVRLVERLDRTVLPIQGPPGAGKTFTAARMIVESIRLGRRVGITAQSHKVISNLLAEVCRAAAESGVELRAVQKGDSDQHCGIAQVARADTNEEVRAALASGTASLAAGTAWLWSREDMIGSVELLFIDEAGQFSLASALAVAPAAGSLVLVGDPRQLDQPIQGVHPPGVDVSALDHLLGGALTVPPDRGLFLDMTWRLHPAICDFTSEIFYDARLQPRDGLELQQVSGGPLTGSGLRFVPVHHSGNQSESVEEVDTIDRLVRDILAAAAVWRDVRGETKPLRAADILVVAPYNAQVSALSARLPAGVRVGTVDRFQGQEAPIVIYSMTTSSSADAPRGMSFLFSPNRLNVATSRARCLAVVVGSPLLFAPDCRTPAQMRLANAFCRFAELAGAGTLPAAVPASGRGGHGGQAAARAQLSAQ
jgi:predicted RecB family nuclease